MKIIKSQQFKPEKAWDALTIANMNGITIRLHWANKAYQWHTNTGEEVFVVLSGAVEMHYRQNGAEASARLDAGDIFFASTGTEHSAQPSPEAHILVIEQEGSE